MSSISSLSLASCFACVLGAAPIGFVPHFNPPPTAERQAAACDVTAPPDQPFVAPAPYPSNAPYAGNFWYGGGTFWTMLRDDGTWRSLPRNADGFRQKIFWWSPGYSGASEPRPALIVSGKRLDAPGSFLHKNPATNAHHDDFGGWAMLTGVDVPTSGCWELTGMYRGQTLKFVVRVDA